MKLKAGILKLNAGTEKLEKALNKPAKLKKEPKPPFEIIEVGATPLNVTPVNKLGFDSIRDFVELSGKYAGFDIEWQGEGVNEVGIDKKTGKTVVKVNPKFFRPAEVELLIGDPSKAEKVLGWKRKVSYEGLCKMMVEADVERYKNYSLIHA